MNIVVLAGRLTKDPDIRQSGDTKIANINIATDKFVRGERSADFHNCVAFGRNAEFIEKFFHKGDFILIHGSNVSGSYDGKDGKKVYTYQVMINSVEFGGGKGSGATGGQQSAPRSNTRPANNRRGGFLDIPDDAGNEGLPFD